IARPVESTTRAESWRDPPTTTTGSAGGMSTRRLGAGVAAGVCHNVAKSRIAVMVDSGRVSRRHAGSAPSIALDRAALTRTDWTIENRRSARSRRVHVTEPFAPARHALRGHYARARKPGARAAFSHDRRGDQAPVGRRHDRPLA